MSPWTLGFEAPVAVSFSLDRSSDEAITVREGDGGIVQLFVGIDVWLSVTLDDEVATIVGDELPEEIIDGVIEISRIPVPTEDPATPESNPEMFRAPSADEAADDEPAPEEPVAAGEVDEELDFEDTLVGPEAPAVSDGDAGPAAPSASPEPDFDDTIIGATTDPGATAEVAFDDDTIIIAPGEPPAHPDADTTDAGSDEPAPPLVATIRVSDASGSRVRQVTEALFLGRAPRLPSGASGTLVQLASPAAQVSSSHLQLSPAQGGTVLARDLNSTNGTIITPPIGMPFRLSPGEQYPLSEGSRIDLGDGVVVSVLGSTAERAQ